MWDYELVFPAKFRDLAHNSMLVRKRKDINSLIIMTAAISQTFTIWSSNKEVFGSSSMRLFDDKVISSHIVSTANALNYTWTLLNTHIVGSNQTGKTETSIIFRKVRLIDNSNIQIIFYENRCTSGDRCVLPY